MKSYNELEKLFFEFKEFIKPPKTDGFHDYSSTAMTAQLKALPTYKARLKKIDRSNWSREQISDSILTLAIMNGLEFNLTFHKPWIRDPSFYSTISMFEQTMCSAVRIPNNWPLSESQLKEFSAGIKALPKALAQAKINLISVAKDFAKIAIRLSQMHQKRWQECLISVQQFHPEIANDVTAVITVETDYQNWLADNMDSFNSPLGVGIKAYSWYLKNVHLFPYNWHQSQSLVKRELSRAQTYLKIEEIHNRNIPELTFPKDLPEFQARYKDAQNKLIAFVGKLNLFPGENYIHKNDLPQKMLAQDDMNFFLEILNRSHLPLVSHDICGHSPDDGYTQSQTSAIRKNYFEYHISGFRAEAMATSIEEILTHMGLVDDNPRARELMYILLAFRAARAMSDLLMNANKLTFQQGIDYAIKNTPRGYYKDDELAWDELKCYIKQPAYGLGYLVGKLQLEQLISDYSRIKGDDFNLGEFYQNFLNRGMLPITLLRWEMTGLTDELIEIF